MPVVDACAYTALLVRLKNKFECCTWPVDKEFWIFFPELIVCGKFCIDINHLLDSFITEDGRSGFRAPVKHLLLTEGHSTLSKECDSVVLVSPSPERDCGLPVWQTLRWKPVCRPPTPCLSTSVSSPAGCCQIVAASPGSAQVNCSLGYRVDWRDNSLPTE
jgi:hypothetical protein